MLVTSKKNRTKTTKGNAKTKSPKPVNYAKYIKRTLIALFFAGVIVIPFLMYVQQSEINHDLSDLGNGTPMVVQIHDPGCQLCQRLKNNLGKVKGEFKDEVQFKTANIMTNKGRRFASGHNVPHVTLLFFDGHGRRVNTLRGVSDSREIKAALDELIKL